MTSGQLPFETFWIPIMWRNRSLSYSQLKRKEIPACQAYRGKWAKSTEDETNYDYGFEIIRLNSRFKDNDMVT